MIRYFNKKSWIQVRKFLSIMERKDKIYGSFAFIFVFCASVCDLLNPFFFAQVLEEMQSGNGVTPLSSDSINWYLFGIMGALAIGSLIFSVLYTYLSVKMSMNISTNLRMKLFAKIQYLTSKDIDKFTNASLITRVTTDLFQSQQLLLNIFPIAIRSVCYILGGFILSFIQITDYISAGGNEQAWYLVSTYGLIVIFFTVVGSIVVKGLPVFNKTRTAIDNNNRLVNENIWGNRLIRAFNLEPTQSKKYRRGNSALKKLSIRGENIFAIVMPFAFFIVNASTIVILLIAGFYAKNNNAFDQLKSTGNLIGVIMSFMQYFAMIMIGLSLISMFAYIASRAKIANRRIFEVINTTPSIESGKLKPQFEEGSIKFKNVSFSYNENAKKQNNTLRDINLDIKGGQWLGIIGQTGSSKSTLISLMCRLYDATDGEVLISGHNIKDFDLSVLQDNIAVSLQEKILLHGTIKSNIKIGKIDASDDEVKIAAKQAEALEFINNKDEGFDSVVEQRGSNLSGGQKQRVSIARALIKKPKILILDDSTSALDTITENKILENLHKNFEKTTVVIVSQKIKSIKSCDQIIVLDQGKIVQRGKHDDLIKNTNGIYYKIDKSQKTSVAE